jgi:hypothetical protein
MTDEELRQQFKAVLALVENEDSLEREILARGERLPRSYGDALKQNRRGLIMSLASLSDLRRRINSSRMFSAALQAVENKVYGHPKP